MSANWDLGDVLGFPAPDDRPRRPVAEVPGPGEREMQRIRAGLWPDLDEGEAL